MTNWSISTFKGKLKFFRFKLLNIYLQLFLEIVKLTEKMSAKVINTFKITSTWLQMWRQQPSCLVFLHENNFLMFFFFFNSKKFVFILAWCNEKQIQTSMENKTVGQLDTNLRRFYAEARNKSGESYSKTSLIQWFPALFWEIHECTTPKQRA